MLSHRLQILIDEERYDRLAEIARARGTSIAKLVREAVDHAFPHVEPRRRTAGSRILEAEPMPVSDVDELLAELDAVRSRRS